MVIAQSSDTHFNTLESIKQALKRSNDEGDLRRVQVKLNDFERDCWVVTSHHLHALYHLLRGSMIAKAARKNLYSRNHSTVELLQESLEMYEECLRELQFHVQNASWDKNLVELRQVCTYEAHVVSSYLRLCGEEPKIIFGTDVLSIQQKHKEQSARRNRHSLSSSF